MPLDWFTDAHASADSELENVKPDVKHSNSTSPHAASAIILVSDMLGHLEGAAACLQGKERKCASGNCHVFAAKVCRYNAVQLRAPAGMPLSPSLLSRFQKADVKLFWAATGQQTVLDLCLATVVSTTNHAYKDVTGVCDNAGSCAHNGANSVDKQQQIWNKISGDLHGYVC